MEQSITAFFTLIGSSQFRLQNLRQLLCEQIQFTPIAAYQSLLASSDFTTIDIDVLWNILGEPCNRQALEGVLKFYSYGQLNIDFQQFQRIVLTRENHLVAKLIRERQPIEASLPPYLANYFKKLWAIEEQLHAQLIQMSKKMKKKDIQLLSKYKKGDIIDEARLKADYIQVSGHINQGCPEIIIEIALRYLKKGLIPQQLHFRQLMAIFVPQNCIVIRDYLSVQDKNYNDRMIEKKLVQSDPYVHKQFKKLQSNIQPFPFSFRQLRSVENHVGRNKKLASPQLVRNKIYQFSKNMEKVMAKFLKSLSKIIKLTAQINQIKIQLIQQQGSHFSHLFKQITKNDSIVPSQLKNYLQTAGINVQLADLFILFKRYADPLSGKMKRKQFVKMFKSCSIQPKQRVNTLFTSEFRKAAVSCLLREIILQQKIEKQKMWLISQADADLRDIFDTLDCDQIGKISRTDIQVAYTRITQRHLTAHDLQLLWRRMGKKNIDEYVQYDLFILEMMPRSRQRRAQHP